jgi:D-threo-aldose 1-dehydrogenase
VVADVTVRLGGTDVEVSSMGLGTAPLGNLYAPIDDHEAAAVVATARSLGITYFDTAPHYGLGLAERRLGAALAGDDDVVVSTKVGRVLEPNPDPDPGHDLDEGFAVAARFTRRWDFSAVGVVRSLDDSRERIGRERIEVVLLHDPDEHMDQALAEALPALVELRDAGVVGAIGAGMNSSAPLARFVETGMVDVVLLAGRYTLLEQGALDDVLPLAIEAGTSVIIGGVFNSGLLARVDVADDARYEYAPAPAEQVARARRIAAVCRAHDTALPAVALQFPLAHPAVAAVLVGAASAAELVEDDAHRGTEIPAELWSALVADGLLRADAPVPIDGTAA